MPNFLGSLPDFTVQGPILSDAQKAELAKLSQVEAAGYTLSSISANMMRTYIAMSAQIQGNQYTIEEAFALWEKGVTAGGKSLTDARMLDDHLRSCIWALSRSGFEVVTPDRIMRLRDALMMGQRGYRNDVQGELADLTLIVEASTKIENPHERAIFLHCNISLLSLHDGINITGRIVQALTQASMGAVPLLTLPENLNRYHHSLAAYQGCHDYGPYVELFMDCFRDQAEATKRETRVNCQVKPSSV